MEEQIERMLEEQQKLIKWQNEKTRPKIESGPPAVLRYEKLRWLWVVLRISYQQNEVSLIIVGFVIVIQALHKAKKKRKKLPQQKPRNCVKIH